MQTLGEFQLQFLIWKGYKIRISSTIASAQIIISFKLC